MHDGTADGRADPEVPQTNHSERSLVMNKRIISLLLCFVMVFALSVAAVPVSAADYSVSKYRSPHTSITVSADKTTASPGDEITYSIILQETETITGFAFSIEIPEGLTFVSGSGNPATSLFGIKPTWDEEPEKLFTCMGDGEDYTGSFTVFGFRCKVNDDAPVNSSLTVSLINVEGTGGSTVDYADISASINVFSSSVTVSAPKKPATAISLDKTTLDICVGDTAQLSATVTPADTTDKLTWSSGNSAVAEVDGNGKITAKAPGTAVITVKANDKVKATCTVNVSKAPCKHPNKATVAEKQSDCKTKGWDAYQKCNDCGKLFDMKGNEIGGIPYRELSTTHTGGKATCTKQAVCSICGKSYGETAAHNYTAKNETEAALKTKYTAHEGITYV